MEFFGCEKRNISSGKPKRNQPKKIPKTFESLKATIEKKKKCNSKALEIVTNLSDQTVHEDVLLNSVPHINQEYYQDIIEERAINKLCGYPLCSKNLRDIPKKQYHISTAQNKVFDITDRKNFCSNLCYKASRYLKDQILTKPLWLRENEPATEYKLLPLYSKGGGCGDEVDLGVTYVKPDVDGSLGNSSQDSNFIKDEVTTHDHVTDSMSAEKKEVSNTSLKEEYSVINDELIQEKIDDCVDISKKNNIIGSDNNSFSELNNISSERLVECLSCHAKVSCCHCEDITNLGNIGEGTSQVELECSQVVINQSKSPLPKSAIINSDCVNETKVADVTVNKSKNESSKDSKHKKAKSHRKQSKNTTEDPKVLLRNLVIKTENILKEWFTLDTLCFIVGEEKVKELLTEKQSHIKDIDTIPRTSMDSQFYEQYLAICKKLNILELEDMKTDQSFREKVKNPLPDYNALKEEAKELDLKVKMFYKGDKVQFDQSNLVSNQDSKSEASNFEPIIPPVDLHAQKALRRRIVSDKLFKVIQDLQRSLGLRGLNITEYIRTMISTFLLSAHNIALKPLEWNLIAIFIIKLLSIKDAAIEEALDYKMAKNHLTLILMTYSLDSGYLDRLVLWLTEIDYIIQKHSS